MTQSELEKPHCSKKFLAAVAEYKKSELMLMRCARAYSSFCSQVILVYLHQFRCSSLFCNQKLPKNHQKPIFLGFKVINVDNVKKLVSSACYVKQRICAFL